MNVRDSEQVARQLAERGYGLASSEAEADVILLNTCSVRDQAEQKAIGKLTDLSRLRGRKPELVLGLMGCMAQRIPGELIERLPEVDLVVGTQKFHRVADHVEVIRKARQTGQAPGVPVGSKGRKRGAGVVDVAEEAGSQNAIREHVLGPRQVTAFVSIMQGCNMHCTFCIVPTTRGAERSRPIESIVAEVESLAARGVREVTLLGQIVNLYGRHEFPKDQHGRSPFVQMLRAVCAVPGIERVRFTSPHPIGFRQDLIDAFKELPPLCEHVHLPLQSGSNRILKAMHRAYTAEHYLRLVDRLREAQPALAITTDIIVGFPGETGDDYSLTRALVERVHFDNAFIFRYSQRTGTPATELPDQLDEDTKMARNQDLLSVISAINDRRNASLLGTTQEILVEGESKNNPARFQGRTRTNKLVLIEANERWRGQLLPVKLHETTGFTYYAEPVLTDGTLTEASPATP